MSEGMISSGLLDELKSLNTAEDIETFLDRRGFTGKENWQSLGGRNNNASIVQMVGDPANALTERVTNGVDAVIERGVLENEVNSPSSPREAVTQLFGLSKAGYNEMSTHWVTETAKNNFRVSIVENGKENRPVIEVQDNGVGQHPEDFPQTFLSLNEDSKITKPYLIGKYGQGGATTFNFTEYAIIISRRYDGGDIGWSIVRYNPRTSEEEEYANGVYEYLTRDDGSIPTISESEANGFTGSIVRLVEYDATNFSNSVAGGKNNLYAVLHRTMFGAIFPFMVEDQRFDRYASYNGKPRRRSVVGSRYRLDKPSKHVAHTRDFMKVDLREYGTIQIKYWILNDKRKIKQFIEPTNPIVFTLHGQRHHTENKRFFKRTDHTFLKDRIIVEVNCDELSQEGKRAFTSTREDMTNSDAGRAIRQNLLEALSDDEQLIDLNEKYKNEIIRETSSDQEERAKTLLADLLRNPEPGEEKDAPAEGNDEPGEGTSTGGGKGNDNGPDQLHDYPNYIEIKNKADPIPAKQGRTLRLKVELDAKDKFESLDWGEIHVEVKELSDISYHRETSLKDGNKFIYFSVDKNEEIGETGMITAVVEWENGKYSDTRDVEIVEPPKRSGNNEAGEYQAPDIIQVTRENNSLGWDETDVAEFHPNEDEVGRVYVSMFNQQIEPILDTLDVEEATVEQRKSEYTGYMAFYEVKREREATEGGGTADDDYISKEMNRVAQVLMSQIVSGMNPEMI